MLNEYAATRFICQKFEKNWYFDNQKVQVADERDIWNYLVRYDEADLALHEFPANLM